MNLSEPFIRRPVMTAVLTVAGLSAALNVTENVSPIWSLPAVPATTFVLEMLVISSGAADTTVEAIDDPHVDADGLLFVSPAYEAYHQ